MKKSLLLLLSLAMVFTMFASVAFAADETTSTELTAQQKFDALVAAGVMTGTVVNGETVAGLDQPMNRAQIAEVLVNLFQLPKTATSSSFTDVSNNHWAMQQIEAAKAAGYMFGNGDGTFTPDKNITLEQVASIICEVFGLAPATDAAVGGTTSSWATGYVAAAIAAGLLSNVSDFTADASRADLVNVSYSAYEKAQEPQPGTANFAATGASQITVSFSGTVDDTAAFTVKKGSIPINISSTKLSDDKKSVVLTTTTKLTKGDYTITGTNPAVSGTITVDDEKVTKITFTSDKAPLKSLTDLTKVYAFLKVFNQYNEDITSTSNLNVNSGNGAVTIDGTNKGKLTITAPGTSQFTIGQTVSVTALDTKSATFASAVLTVSEPSAPATITVTKLTKDDKEAQPTVGDTAADYTLHLTAVDQYGNSVDAAGFTDNVVITPTNPSVADISKTDNKPVFAAGKDDVLLKLSTTSGTFDNAGTSQIIVISTRSGSKTTFDITVKDKVKVDVLTVNAPEIAVAGEDITIPFQAVDQFGAEITSASKLSAVGAFLQNPTVSGVAGTPAVAFKQDYVNDKANLVVTGVAASDTNQTLFFSAVTSTGKLVTLNIAVQPTAKPVVVTGLKDVKTGLATGASTAIKAKNILVLDQYSREKTFDKFVGDYTATIASSADVVALSGSMVDDEYVVADGDDSVTLTGADSDTGNSTVTVTLHNSDGVIANSAKGITFKVVNTSSIVDYNVADINTIYVGDAPVSGDMSKYARAVTVTGLLSDGTEVAIATNDEKYYTVTEVTYTAGKYGISYNGTSGKLEPTSGTTLSGKDDTSFALTIVATTKDGSKVVSKTVNVSGKAPVATTVALRSGDNTTKEGDGVISVPKGAVADFTALANDANIVKDQYGVEITSASKFVNAIASNLPSGVTTLAGVAEGKTFTLTAVTGNGLVSAFKVIVTAAVLP